MSVLALVAAHNFFFSEKKILKFFILMSIFFIPIKPHESAVFRLISESPWCVIFTSKTKDYRIKTRLNTLRCLVHDLYET